MESLVKGDFLVQARKILGPEYDHISDDQLLDFIEVLMALGNLTFNSLLKIKWIKE